ncbi:MAG: FAD-dependent oxidoreductase [Myxococcota bacterium]|nr:FAD-dependent oxidoreductase [Myxococcota bacterium]
MTPRFRVVILGGGPAGLAAGRELALAGVDVTVLERAPWVGGLSMTAERNGFRFDLGGHRWFTKNEWLEAWFQELMQGELLRVERRSRIYFEGRFFDYPIRIPHVIRELGFATSARALAAYLWGQLRARAVSEPVENMEQAYLSQFGRVLYDMFFRRYSEKVWGRPCSELSADWVAQRTRGLSVWDAVRNAIAPRWSAERSLEKSFCYPRLGYQRISERLREDIESRGGRVLLEAEATDVSLGDTRVTVDWRDAEGRVHELECDHVISTVALGQLVHMVRPTPPSEVLDAAKGLEFRNLVTVNLLLDRSLVTPDTWLYVHDPAIGFARIHEPANWSPDMAPPGKTSLCAEWFCSLGDEIWRLSDEELVARTVGHLVDDLGFIRRSDVIEGFALRARRAYPVYGLDYRSRVDRLKTHLAHDAERISIAGRGGTFRYNNADHSIEMGILVARNLLGESHDVDRVNTEPEYLEERRAAR